MLARTFIQRSLRTCSHRRAFRASLPCLALTPRQTDLIKSSVPVLAEHGIPITTHFYKRMLGNHPELKNMFNAAHQETGNQPAALAHAVWAYAANIDNLPALASTVSRIGHKHASLGVTADQYPIVGENLLESIKEVLGDAVNEELLDAWRAAYGQLAGVFIDFESNLYKEAANTPGGWAGWRKFTVSGKVPESEEITSFHLTPGDQGTLPQFKPGQFISIRYFIPELGVYQPRQYSLSDTPDGKHFRISVKREVASAAHPAGRISNILHDQLPVGAEIEVSFPFGDFVLDLETTTPVVLMSGGVGLTPMMAMLETLILQSKSRPIAFVHAVRNAKVHAMKDHLRDVVAQNPQVSRAVFYEEVHEGEDVKGKDYDFEGRVDLEKIRDMVLLPDAHYYVCGPKGFMEAEREGLAVMGVPEERIHWETFGAPV